MLDWIAFTERDKSRQKLAGFTANITGDIVDLPAGSVGFFSFVGAYAPSVVIGLISHVPGGVGVFEGSLSALLARVPAATRSR